MTEAGAMFSDGKVYERMMGRWSKLVGRVFLEWLNAPKNLKWIEVGCGNGAFTEELIAFCLPLEVTAVDPSEGQLSFARTRQAAKDAAGIGHHQIGGDACNFLGDNHHVHQAAARTAVFFRKWQSDQPGFRPRLEQFFRISALAIVLAHIVRRRVLLQKLAHAGSSGLPRVSHIRKTQPERSGSPCSPTST